MELLCIVLDFIFLFCLTCWLVVVHDNQKKIAEKLDKIKKDNGKSQDTMSDIETVLREALQKIEEHNNNADTD